MARARKKPWMQMVLSSTGPSFLLVILLMSVYLNSRVLAYTELIKDDHLEGPNVCKEVDNIPITITTPREEAYQERYQKWCLGIPPRCSAYRIKIRTVNETRTIIKQRIVKKCCVGYQLDESETHCVPECKAGCVNGTCVNPDVCRCNKGFAGKTCNISCPPNVWGSDCKQPCKCRNGAACNAADGSCECNRGFKGRYCEETCPSDRFGQNCVEFCQCENGGKCDNVSGECYCAPGFTGPLCADTCPAGTHGKQCQSKCRCQNGGTCDPVSGECVCPAGFTGTVCANRCQPGWYGLECANRCECFNGADCDRVTGQCICAPGFMGAKCLDSCPSNQFGINCTETCRCLNEALCDSSDGKCTCPDGWTGADCGERICPIDRYGANCTGICDCKWSNTKMCHPWTGKCLCEPGWSNSACDRPCRFLRYGQDCQLTCNCKNSSPCSHIDGTCLCIAGFKGESCEEPCSNNMYGQNCSERCQCMNGATCDGDTGKCNCAPGWQGIKCDRPCDAQHYGRDCTEKCLCQNGGVCNPINGQCTCPAGWTGELCEKKCTPGRFGQNCEQLCDCHLDNILACNATTGRCICKREWGGVRCESRCPLGYYGESCSEICTCHNNSSCDPTTGACVCSRGWTGPACNEPCPKGFFGHGCMERCAGSTETNRTCNPITGQYVCSPGYIGLTCEHPCSSGYYGQDCAKVCDCKNGGECNHVTGECQCTPGWMGQNCTRACEDMYYGSNCSQRCNCHNNADCRKNDGACICKDGWMGHRCEEVCPEGFYGNHCMYTCQCPPGNYVCHAAKGCVCMVGWTGKNCDERMTNKLTQEIESVNEVNYTSVEESTSNNTQLSFDYASKLYNIRIDLINNFDTQHPEREHHLIVTNDKSRPKVSAVYNVTIEFPLYGNSFLSNYNRTHTLRPGQQITLLYREDGFLDLTLVQMNSYVTLTEPMQDSSMSSSSNFMETFINSTSYRVAMDEDLNVNVSCVDLQKRVDKGFDCDGNRTVLLQVGQKMIIRLISMGIGIEPTKVTTISTSGLPSTIETSYQEVEKSKTKTDDDLWPDKVLNPTTSVYDELPSVNLTHEVTEITSEDEDDIMKLPYTTIATWLGSATDDKDQQITEKFDATENSSQDIVQELPKKGIVTGGQENISQKEVRTSIRSDLSITTAATYQEMEKSKTRIDGKLPPDQDINPTLSVYDDLALETSTEVVTVDQLITVVDERELMELPYTTTATRMDSETDDNEDQQSTVKFDETGYSSEDTVEQSPKTEIVNDKRGNSSHKEVYDNRVTESSMDDTGATLAPHKAQERYLTLLREMFRALYAPNGIEHVENETNSSSVVAEPISAPEGLAGSTSFSVLAVILTILFLCIFAAMLLYYRRRVANLKAEVNHVVNYMTQEQPSHFDNPVYARTGGANGGIANGTLSSNGTIVPPLDARTGLLRNVIPSNLRDVMSGRRKPKHDKYSYPDNEYGVAKSYSIAHYGAESLKNIEADLTNPNLVDHLYDEIKLKESYTLDADQYDHLDYSRAGSSHKAHYFHMPDGNTNHNNIPGTSLPNGTLNGGAIAGTSGGGGSPKAINVLREATGGSSINNLSAPTRMNKLLPTVPSVIEAKCSDTDLPNLGNDLSSSSNSSPTPPSSPPSPSLQRQRLVPSGDDLYVPMSAGGCAPGTSGSSSNSSEFGGLNIPNHQLNIKE